MFIPFSFPSICSPRSSMLAPSLRTSGMSVGGTSSLFEPKSTKQQTISVSTRTLPTKPNQGKPLVSRCSLISQRNVKKISISSRHGSLDMSHVSHQHMMQSVGAPGAECRPLESAPPPVCDGGDEQQEVVVCPPLYSAAVSLQRPSRGIAI